MNSSESVSKLVYLGMYWRIRPLRFSLGRVLMRGNWAQGNDQMGLDLTLLASGIYCMDLAGKGSTVVQRIVRGR